MDNLRNINSTVAIRYGYGVHHGWSDPYTARNCHNSGAGPRYSGAESSVTSTIGCGTVYKKGRTAMRPFFVHYSVTESLLLQLRYSFWPPLPGFSARVPI